MLRALHQLSFSAPAAPVFDRLTRRRYRESYRFLVRSQWLSRDEIARLQLGGLRRLLTHAYEYSPFHRERLRAAGWSPGSPVDFRLLQDLPTLEREDLQERLDEVATVSRFRFERLDTVATGGTTTGQPLKMFNEGLASDRKGAARLRTNLWAGHKPGEKLCLFGGRALLPGGEVRTDVLNALKGQKIVLHWDVSDAALDGVVREVNSFRPRLLMCYPSTISALCSYLEARGLRLQATAVLLTGEMVTRDCEQRTEQVLGLPVYEAYGCCELGDAA